MNIKSVTQSPGAESQTYPYLEVKDNPRLPKLLIRRLKAKGPRAALTQDSILKRESPQKLS